MKDIKNFVLDTPISQKYGVNAGKVYGYARITFSAEYRGGPYFDRDYCDLTVSEVLAKVGLVEADITLAYQLSKQLSDTLAEIIEDAAFAHSEYLFDNPGKMAIEDIEYTDLTQDEAEATQAKQYGVTMIVEAPSEKAA